MKTINNILIYGAVAAMSLLGSCTKEPSTDGELSGEAIYINLSSEDDTQTRAQLQTDNEKRITSAYIFFYGTVDGTNKDKLVKGVSTSDDGVSTDGSKVVVPASIIDIKQAYKIVVVANGGVAFNVNDIVDNSDISLLNDKLTTITTQIQTPTVTSNELLMSGTIDSHTFSQNPVATVNLVRQAVKLNVKVTMSKTFTDNYPDAKFGTGIDGVDAPELLVLNVPNDSYVMRRATPVLPSKRYLDYLDLAMTASATEWTVTAYAYENPTKGTDDKAKSEATYFILQLPYKLNADSEVVTDNYYKFYINDPADPTNPHKTISNTHYNVSVAVNGFGGAVPDINGAQVITTVLPWEGEISQTDPVGEYLKVPSAIEIEYGEDFKLNIQASHAVTLTKTNPKITITQVGKVITLRSDDMDTKVKTPNYDKITVKMGSLTQEVKVSYRPHPGYLMDKWNLTANANGITSTQGEVAVFFSDQANYGSYFKYGSVIPIKCYQTGPLDPMYKSTDALWLPTGVTRPLTWVSIPSQNSKFVVHTLDGVRAGKGDPCRLMGLTNNDISSGRFDNGRWRLPTIKELKKIGNGPTITNAYWRNITEPEATNLHARYRYSDKFELFFPLAGASGDNGIAVITPRLLHLWGMWQANSMALESGSDWYDAMSTNNHLSPSGGAPPFVVGGGSPLTKGHSVRCIQQ